MKNFIALVLAAVIIGFLSFVLVYWVFHFSYAESINIAESVTVGSIVVEYLKPYILKITKSKSKQS